MITVLALDLNFCDTHSLLYLGINNFVKCLLVHITTQGPQSQQKLPLFVSTLVIVVITGLYSTDFFVFAFCADSFHLIACGVCPSAVLP